MKNFLTYTLATITGIIIASFLLFFILLASVSMMVAAGDKAVSINENSILVLKAGVPIPDKGDPSPFAGLDLINMTLTPAPGLNDILKNLEKAKSDDKIKGVLIENGLLPPGWATTEELRNGLKNFREESGKFVISYSDYVLEQEGYYLSTIADKIYINPASTVDFKGLSGEVMFYKKALEKLGVEVQVIRHGTFKGAVEPFILEHLSDENRAQIKDYVTSIWNHAVEMMSQSRGMPAEKINMLADELAGSTATGALESKLVDGLFYRDELEDTLKILAGLKNDDKIRFVSMSKYSKVPDTKKIISVKNRISVIYASGSIVMGKGNEYNIGSEKFAEIIRKERVDTAVKAIVLRVNSPGGSVLASDIIWREIDLAAKTKPLVISMGNYAASGGYYISAPATRIYANPTTISGSIGVFVLVPNTGNLLENKLGISTEYVNTNKYSDFPSVYRPLKTYETEVMQRSIEKIYNDFVTRVSAGRKMAYNDVDNIGQGRVWSGLSARNIGLVDEIGGLSDAVKGAASLANIETYAVRELPLAEDPYTKLINQMSGEIRMKILIKELGENIGFYDRILQIRDLSGIQAVMPYFIDIH